MVATDHWLEGHLLQFSSLQSTYDDPRMCASVRVTVQLLHLWPCSTETGLWVSNLIWQTLYGWQVWADWAEMTLSFVSLFMTFTVLVVVWFSLLFFTTLVLWLLLSSSSSSSPSPTSKCRQCQLWSCRCRCGRTCRHFSFLCHRF